MNTSTVLVLFQKFHRELCLLLLVLFGLACGQLVATLAGTALRPDTTLEPGNQPTQSSTNAQISNRDLNQILQQNIFDPSARGHRATAVNSSQQQGTPQAAPRKDLALIGTLVADTSSTALIEVGKEIKLFHLEDTLPGGGRVETIQRNRVVLRNRDGSSSELALHEEGAHRTSQKAARPTGSGIRKAGENRWAVSRGTADAARANIAEQLRLAQMEPRIINGRTDGFRVRQLYPNSLLAKMGILRGDVILRVNDMTLDSPEKALQILQQLREARQLTVDLERRDKPMTFAYEID